MKYTLAEANKALKQMNDEVNLIRGYESDNKTFRCAINENVDDVKPEYNFDESRNEIASLNAKIRKMKHAINVANTTTRVNGMSITIDEALIYIPQLTFEVNTLASMAAIAKKVRCNTQQANNNGYWDYLYANFDPDHAKNQCVKMEMELNRLQIALDYTNSNTSIEVDL